MGNILRRSDPAKWNLLNGVLSELVAQASRHGGFDEAGRHCVAGYGAGSDFAGDGHGEPDQSRLGCRVVGLARLAHLPEDTRDVDDASPALLEHGTDDLLYREICRRQIGAEYGIPVGTLHAHYQLIACNPGVVDQNVDLAELSYRGFAGGLDLRFIADVNCEGRSRSACGSNLPRQLIKFLLTARRQGDSSPGTGQLQRATPPNSLRCASDQGNPAGNIHGFSSGS